jgi:hypothetical protein
MLLDQRLHLIRNGGGAVEKAVAEKAGIDVLTVMQVHEDFRTWCHPARLLDRQNIALSADDDNKVIAPGVFERGPKFLVSRRTFAKQNDVRPEVLTRLLATKLSAERRNRITIPISGVTEVDDVLGVMRRTHLPQLTMQMDDLVITSLFAKIIEVLSQMQNLRSILFADASDHFVCWIGLYMLHRNAKVVAEPVDQLGVPRQRFARHQLLSGHATIETARATEGLHPAVSRKPCARQENDLGFPVARSHIHAFHHYQSTVTYGQPCVNRPGVKNADGCQQNVLDIKISAANNFLIQTQGNDHGKSFAAREGAASFAGFLQELQRNFGSR